MASLVLDLDNCLIYAHPIKTPNVTSTHKHITCLQESALNERIEDSITHDSTHQICSQAHVFYVSVPKLPQDTIEDSVSAMQIEEDDSRTTQQQSVTMHGTADSFSAQEGDLSPLSEHFSSLEESEFSPASDIYGDHTSHDFDEGESASSIHLHTLSSAESPVPSYHYKVICRPYLFAFLHQMQRFGYSLFIYTASNKNYATGIVQNIQQLFRKHYNYDLEFKRCLYRSDCIEKRHSYYLKDLTLFSEQNDMSRVVLLDNNLGSGTFDTESNVMEIESFYGDKTDKELLKAAEWLRRLDMSEKIKSVTECDIKIDVECSIEPEQQSEEMTMLYKDIPALLKDYAKSEHVRKLGQRVTELFLT